MGIVMEIVIERSEVYWDYDVEGLKFTGDSYGD